MQQVGVYRYVAFEQATQGWVAYRRPYTQPAAAAEPDAVAADDGRVAEVLGLLSCMLEARGEDEAGEPAVADVGHHSDGSPGSKEAAQTPAPARADAAMLAQLLGPAASGARQQSAAQLNASQSLGSALDSEST
jgi:hypothetical protein